MISTSSCHGDCDGCPIGAGVSAPTGLQAVGWRVGIFLASDAAIATGTLDVFDPSTSVHHVALDDGRLLPIHLPSEKICWVLPPEKQVRLEALLRAPEQFALVPELPRRVVEISQSALWPPQSPNQATQESDTASSAAHHHAAPQLSGERRCSSQSPPSIKLLQTSMAKELHAQQQRPMSATGACPTQTGYVWWAPAC